MSSKKIIEKAIYSFSTNGYNGTSIASIAELVGIKKSTVYSHYKSKDEIFEKSMEVSFQAEIEFVDEYFSKKYESPLKALEIFLDTLKNRYLEDDNYTTNFMYRIGYRLVEKYDNVIKKYCDEYYFHMEDKIIEYLIAENIPQDKSRELAMVYTTLLDGFMISLIYCGEDRYEGRKQQVWSFFSESFSRIVNNV